MMYPSIIAWANVPVPSVALDLLAKWEVLFYPKLPVIIYIHESIEGIRETLIWNKRRWELGGVQI